MGIFTDEEHVERIQTDEEKIRPEPAPKDERVLLTQRQIKQDVAMRALDEAVRALLMAVAVGWMVSMFWLMNDYVFWACLFFGLFAAVFFAFFMMYFCRMIRFMRFGRKIHVYRTVLLGHARQPIAYLLSPRRSRHWIGDMILLKDFRALPNDLNQPIRGVGHDAAVYVVTFDHKTSVEVYPCARFRWEGEENGN